MENIIMRPFFYSHDCIIPMLKIIYNSYVSTKAHIPLEMGIWGLRWVPNANETYTKNMKCTWPTPVFCIWTQRNLYSINWRRGLASGLM